MTLLERIKREGVGIILEEGSARDELRKLSANLGYEFDEVRDHVLARGLSPGEFLSLLRSPKPTNGNAPSGKLNGAEHTLGGERSPQSGKRLVVQRASDIQPEAVDWLWRGRIAVGKSTLIGGDPGLGKSTLATSIIANVSQGGQWPCNEGSAPKRAVIVLCAEDGAADTIVPRLMAAGADLSKVHIVTAVHEADSNGRRLFNLSKDLDVLENLINKIGDVGIVTIDPVDAYIGAGIDGHKNTAVRAVLEPISEMAGRLRVAILAITHFSKQPGGKALYRFIGSIAHIGSARVAFTVMADTENEGRVLVLHAKNNLASPQKGLAFRIQQHIVADGIVASSVCFDNEHVSQTADQALAAENGAGERATAKDDAAKFLRTVLADGPMAVADIEAEARAAGLLGATQPISQCKPIRSARDALGINVYQRKGQKAGGWCWAMPGQMPSEGSDSRQKKRATDGGVGL
jgi:putative DNA primase/helicase